MMYTNHMSRILPIIAIFFFCLNNKEVRGQSSTNTIQDHDGNSYTTKTFPDNKTWMTANLNINIPESYCYEDSVKYCKQYGRLYTWKAAMEGCKLLGNGWRLPTNEEWQQMAKW